MQTIQTRGRATNTISHLGRDDEQSNGNLEAINNPLVVIKVDTIMVEVAVMDVVVLIAADIPVEVE